MYHSVAPPVPPKPLEDTGSLNVRGVVVLVPIAGSVQLATILRFSGAFGNSERPVWIPFLEALIRGQGGSIDVCFWHLADISDARSHVCFYLKARVMFYRPVMLK